MLPTSEFAQGDRVTYTSNCGSHESGIVSSVNDIFVFVKFDTIDVCLITNEYPLITAQACYAHQLKKMKQI